MTGRQAQTTGTPRGVARSREQLRDAAELNLRSGGVFERCSGAPQEEPLLNDRADMIDARPGRVVPDADAAGLGALLAVADELTETLAQLEATAWRIHPLRATRPSCSGAAQIDAATDPVRVSSYRSQFHSIIRGSSFATLLGRLRNREARSRPDVDQGP